MKDKNKISDADLSANLYSALFFGIASAFAVKYPAWYNIAVAVILGGMFIKTYIPIFRNTLKENRHE